MKFTQSEKMEIIRMVESSNLSVKNYTVSDNECRRCQEDSGYSDCQDGSQACPCAVEAKAAFR